MPGPSRSVRALLIIQREERYYRDHSEADSFYGFGFQWRAGSKD